MNSLDKIRENGNFLIVTVPINTQIATQSQENQPQK